MCETVASQGWHICDGYGGIVKTDMVKPMRGKDSVLSDCCSETCLTSRTEKRCLTRVGKLFWDLRVFALNNTKIS